MPRIPTYLAELPYRPAEGDVAAAGAPGRALAAFGETAGQFAETIADHIKSNQRAEQDRQKQLAEQAKRAHEENERAWASASSFDALEQTIASFERDTDPATIMQRYWDRIGDIRVTLSDRIGDPAARQREVADFQAYADVRGTLLQGDAAHGAAERGRRELGAHLARYGDLAAGARHPLAFDDLVAAAEREIAAKTEAGFITGEDAARLEREFYGDLARRQAERAIAEDPDEALSRLRDETDFPLLGADARARLTERAGREALARAVARESEWMARRRETLTGVAATIDDLRDGAPSDDGRFTREGLVELLGEREGAERWDAIEAARRFGRTAREVRWATPDQLAARRSALEGDPAQSQAAADFAAAAARRDEQLRAQPADYVLANPHVASLHRAMRDAQEQSAASPELPAELTGALQAAGVGAPPSVPDAAESRRAATQAYANATLAEQERLGVAEERRRLLPDTEAGDLAATLVAADPAEADRRLRDLAAEWGADWPAVRKELVAHGLPGEVRLLADIEEPAARQTFAKVLAAQASDHGALRIKTGADAEAVDQILVSSLSPSAKSADTSQALLAASPSGASIGAIGQPVGRGTMTWDKVLPQSHPQDASDRAKALADVGQRLGRHTARVPPPQKPKAIPVFLKHGQPLKVFDGSNQQIDAVIPDGWDLGYFAFMGERLRARDEYGNPQHHMSLSSVAPLPLFRQGRIWDLQRIGAPAGDINHEFRPISSVAIGVYAAAAGIPFEVIMEIQNAYAWIASRFDQKELKSNDYPNLPQSNVDNTRRGYDLYKSGEITAKIAGP